MIVGLEGAEAAVETSGRNWPLAALVLVVGFSVVWLAAAFFRRRLVRSAKPHRAMVASKAILYVGNLAVLLVVARSVLQEDLTTYLAAAGVLTVAIGFASQTSLSNLIAGIFLLVDRPFEVGDAIEIETRVGTVDEITLLSTYVRTFDNVRVRWPNEVVLKATILNYTRYDARRIVLKVGVAYGSDTRAARAAILAGLEREPMVLFEPPPMAWARELGDSAITIEVFAWVARTEFLEARSRVVEVVHDSLGAAGIEIPFPQRTVWMRSDR